jgi:adenine/guanine/hypoxanthine permease
MAYIVFVNPTILHETGMPFTAVVAATCLSAAFGSILMGAYARYPIALAPGMGLNAYFTYTVVKGMGVPWQTALGAVFLSGVAFFILTLTGLRQAIIAAIPAELYSAVAAGVGLFIAFKQWSREWACRGRRPWARCFFPAWPSFGLRNAGLIVPDPATTVTLGNLRDPHTLLAVFGLLLIALLLTWGVRAAMLLGILGTTLAGAAVGLVPWHPQTYRLSEISATAFRLDLASTFKIGLTEIVFVFLFVDLFDNIGTLVAVGKKAGLFVDNKIPRIERIFLADASATIVGSLTGTSTVVSYIESSAGVAAGGRTGVTAIVTGLLFIVALFVAPLVGAIPAAATAPALIIVGSFMTSAVGEIDWSDFAVAIPAFLTMMMIPLTFSIANGLAFGFTTFTLLKVFRGQFRKVNAVVYILTLLFLLRFYYMGKG